MNNEPISTIATREAAPETPIPSKPRKPRVLPSKISELPSDLRTLVNESLYNHVPYPKIIELLAQKGHPGFNRSNISRWKKIGYEEWLLHQQRIQSVCLKVDDVHKHIDKFGAQGVDQCDRLNKIYLAAHITQTIQGFDPNMLVGDINKKPSRFYKLARIINTQSLERQRQEKIDLIREKFSAAQPTGPTAAGEQAVRLAFGIPDSWSPSGTRNTVTQNHGS